MVIIFLITFTFLFFSLKLSRLTGITDPEVHKTQFDFYSFTPNGVELDDEGLMIDY